MILIMILMINAGRKEEEMLKKGGCEKGCTADGTVRILIEDMCAFTASISTGRRRIHVYAVHSILPYGNGLGDTLEFVGG
mmetsp:Transcript_4055/g.5575  ORF Transcript_4055/g.5575 Transcript_4055/m.5575 type:complete len:80 (+) Transcript_4055:827-1066(+)